MNRKNYPKQDPNTVGDQIANPKKPEYIELLQRIPGVTKFEKFQYMRGMGISEQIIMSTLGIKTHDAFRKMDQKADEIVSNYLRYQAKTGHMQNLTNALIIGWENVFALKEAAEDAKKLRKEHPKDTKYYYPENHFRTSLSNALKEIVELQHKTPLAAAFDKFVKENIIEADLSKKGGRRMAVFPDDLPN
jgi:hypothetical protein